MKIGKLISFCILLLCVTIAIVMIPNINNAYANEQSPDHGKTENSWRYSDGFPIAYDEQGMSTFSLTTNESGNKVFNWYDKFTEGQCSGIGAAKIIDVSQWQGDIDWKNVKAAGIDAAIIRCGYGSNYTDQDDKKWVRNIHGALDANIAVGVYLYSYATNVIMAQSEAEHVLRCLRDQGIDPGLLSLPVFYDIEDNTIANSNLVAQTRVFCDRIQSAGYMAGVYSSTYWWNTYLTSPTFDRYAKWFAQWNAGIGLTCPRASNFKTNNFVWQFSNYGNVSGINGAVDLSYSYMPGAYGTVAPAGSKVLEDGTYEIISYVNSFCMDIAGASKANCANARLWTRNYTAAQKFKLEYNNGFYTITNIASGKVLDVSGASKYNGANIQQYASNNTSAQKWRIDKNSNGTYTITAKCNNKVADISSALFRDATNIRCWSRNNSKAQQFTFQRIDTTPGTKTVAPGVYTIQTALSANSQTPYMLDIAGASKLNCGNAQLYIANGTDAQKFRLTYDGAGFYRITSISSGKVLDVAGASTKNCANVQQYSSNYTDAQRWKIEKNSDGTYTFISKCNAKAMDIPGAICKKCSNVQCYTSNKTDAQKWILSPVQEETEDEN